MTSRVPTKKGMVVVELGGGTGVITKYILERLPEDGRLIVFEVNKVQAEYLRRTFDDPRVTIIEDDAARLPEYLKKMAGVIGVVGAVGDDAFREGQADCIVSSLPLGDFTTKERHAVLSAVNESLGNDGLYIQFQYLLSSIIPIMRLFRLKIVGYELRNVPPAFLYECRKRCKMVQ